MVIVLYGYVIYYAWFGQKLYEGTLQGIQYMSNFGDSFFNMFVLMTTSNYPDIMLPAYQDNRLNAIFFISFLVIGLFLIMNLLLAIIYSNFKTRFEEQIEDRAEMRTIFLFDQFHNIIKDKSEREYMN